MTKPYRVTRTNFADSYPQTFASLEEAITFARGRGWQVGVWEGSTLHYTHCPLYGGNPRTAAGRSALRCVLYQGPPAELLG